MLLILSPLDLETRPGNSRASCGNIPHFASEAGRTSDVGEQRSHGTLCFQVEGGTETTGRAARLSLTLLLKTPRGEARYEAAISWSDNFRKASMGRREPGQLRLDSGSLPAGWFPLPEVVGMLLGLPPICFPQSAIENP